MDLSTFKSLHPCSLEEVQSTLKAAERKVEIFVDRVHSQKFKQLNLVDSLDVYLTTTSEMIGQASIDEYKALFHQVLYHSLQMEVDLPKIRRVKRWKWSLIVSIVVMTLILAFLTRSVLGKSWAFFGISSLTFHLYRLYQYRVTVEISEIQRKTNFKLVKDEELKKLPALYIVDDQTMYLGENMLDIQPATMLYRVEAFEEQVVLKTIYRQYAKNCEVISEEYLIAYYLQVMNS